MLAVARRALSQGDASLQLNDIARQAGVGVGTVYRHFPTRQALLETLVNEPLRQLLEAARAAGAEGDSADGLRTFLRATLDLQLADIGLAEILAAGDLGQQDTVHLRQELDDAVETLLAMCRTTGAVRKDVTPEDLRRLMCGIEHAVRAAGDGSPSLAGQYLEILADGLRPPGASTG
ncbi:TetR/AcrR family transcriptional regulator [Streptomyces sp. NPDC059651]|uniref:TetR/AcrR family transcriptional regulator n=1 Tax=Streptomyces sp. NPDC059651 TaxID=3346897 RepID=UPI003685D471